MTPLMMFLFLLVLFLISIYFVHDINKKEGFISYNQNTPTLNQLYISQYSKANLVYKLFDSVYFDNINGNVIELFGKPFSNTSSTNRTTDVVDNTGSTLTDIILISRPVISNSKMTIRYYDNSIGDVIVDNSIIENKTINSFIYDIIPNESTLYSNEHLSYNYQILYLSWGKDTMIHIYDCSNMKNVNIGTYLFRNSYDPLHFMYRGNLTSSIGSYREDNNPQNNSFQMEPLYDEKKHKSLFQLTSTVLFDTTCRYLIVRRNKAISVYDGTLDEDGINPKMIYTNIQEMGKITNTPTTINMSNFNEFQVLYISDVEGSSFILYVAIPSTKKTLIAVLSMNPTIAGYLTIKCVKTFNQDNISGSGLDGFELKSVQDSKIPSSNEKPIQASLRGSTYVNINPIPTKDTSIPSLDSVISDYYHKYWNENQSIVSNTPQKNDFLLMNEFKSSDKETVNPIPTDSLGNNISDLLSSLSKIKLNETVDSNGKKSIEYTGTLSTNFYLDTLLRNIPGFRIPSSSSSTTSSTITPPPPPPPPPSSSSTTSSTITLPPPPSSSSSSSTTLSKTLPSPPPPPSNNLISSTTLNDKSPPVQINPPLQPFKNINYDENNINSSLLKSPGPTFGNRIVPEGSADFYSYYGSLPEKESSNFIPLAGNFSKFGM